MIYIDPWSASIAALACGMPGFRHLPSTTFREWADFAQRNARILIASADKVNLYGR